jgi:hypothetical protein
MFMLVDEGAVPGHRAHGDIIGVSSAAECPTAPATATVLAQLAATQTAVPTETIVAGLTATATASTAEGPTPTATSTTVIRPFGGGGPRPTGVVPPAVPPPSVITLPQPTNLGGVNFPAGQQFRLLSAPAGFARQPGVRQVTLPAGSILAPVGQSGFAPITLGAPVVGEVAGIHVEALAPTEIGEVLGEFVTEAPDEGPGGVAISRVPVPPVLPSTGGAPSSGQTAAGVSSGPSPAAGRPLLVFVVVALALAATLYIRVRARAGQLNE